MIRNRIGVTVAALLCCLTFMCGCPGVQPGSTSRPAVVSGASMAPNLHGAHIRATCQECNSPFVAGATDDPVHSISLKELRRRFIVCPNCGAASDNHRLEEYPADKVQVRANDIPVRWSVVAFRRSLDGGQQNGVKRVVGLPGESICFDRGNLYRLTEGRADKEARTLLRKPLTIQRTMSVPVYDSRYKTATPRWQTVSESWQHDRWDPAWIWSTFQPCRSFHGSPAGAIGIEDSVPCNQTVDREANDVDELLLKLTFPKQPETEMAVQFNLRGAVFSLAFRWEDSEIQFHKPGQNLPLVWNVDRRKLQDSDSWVIECSSIDHQITAAINGHEVGSDSIVPGDGKTRRQPIRVGWRGAIQVPQRVQLFRDLYYVSAPLKVGSDGRFQPQVLESNQGYLLLGDNVAISHDSRHWQPCEVAKENILGVVSYDNP